MDIRYELDREVCFRLRDSNEPDGQFVAWRGWDSREAAEQFRAELPEHIGSRLIVVETEMLALIERVEL